MQLCRASPNPALEWVPSAKRPELDGRQPPSKQHDFQDAHSTGPLLSLAYLGLAAWAVSVKPDCQVASARVRGYQKISSVQGGLGDPIDDGDVFGGAVASLGDFDQDGVPDLVVGSSGDDDGGLDRGAIWVLRLKADGTVKTEGKISSSEGGFVGLLHDRDFFGSSVACAGDLDSDGTKDLVVGAYHDDDGGLDCGAVWILFLRPDGTVRTQQKISNLVGGLQQQISMLSGFGSSVAPLGDLDGDSVCDVAVGAYRYPGFEANRGEVWILFLHPDGSVKNCQRINNTQGGFQGLLGSNDQFGSSLSLLGDLGEDGKPELAVGAFGDEPNLRGAVWILSLLPGGTVAVEQKIDDVVGGFSGILDDFDVFGYALSSAGDLDQDGIPDLLVGAVLDDDGGASPDSDRGAIWPLLLNADGTVKTHRKISDTRGGFTGILDDGDVFGASVASIGDLDQDGIGDLAVGAPGDDDGGQDRGAVWVLFMGGPKDRRRPGVPASVPGISALHNSMGSDAEVTVQAAADVPLGSLPVIVLSPGDGPGLFPTSLTPGTLLGVFCGPPWEGEPFSMRLPGTVSLSGLAVQTRTFFITEFGN